MNAERGLAALVFTLAGAMPVACEASRDERPLAPTYADVAPILSARCGSCHGGDAPAAGWSASSYVSVIACVSPGTRVATSPTDSRAPIVAVLDTASHSALLTADERGAVRAWVEGGAVGARPTVHAAGHADPRSPAFHGLSLRARAYRPMLDAGDPDACGRCHDGTSSRPPAVRASAPGASACTSCHGQPDGIFSCGTCHGDGARAAPPRDACFFPVEAARAGAHAKHTPSGGGGVALPCGACHPTPSAEPGQLIGGTHGNGSIEISFDAAPVLPGASYDRVTGACTVSCHDRGGDRAKPIWSEPPQPATCSGCHASPPSAHFPGACDTCHREANAAGTALTGATLHMNGKVDVGDGTGGCGACHGHGDDAWPTTRAHPSHAAPAVTTPVDCASCHPARDALLSPGHLDGTTQIAFGGRALDRGSLPTWTGQTCAGVACHGAGLAQPPPAIPAWTSDKGTCASCHGVPPLQHTSSTDCGRPECHSSEVARQAGELSITSFGRSVHIDGVVDVAH